MGVVLHQLNYSADRHVNQQLLALERVNERLFLLYKPILITQVISGHVGVLKQVFFMFSPPGHKYVLFASDLYTIL